MKTTGVRKYIDTLTWDQEPRIESWLKLVETSELHALEKDKASALRAWLNATSEKTT